MVSTRTQAAASCCEATYTAKVVSQRTCLWLNRDRKLLATACDWYLEDATAGRHLNGGLQLFHPCKSWPNDGPFPLKQDEKMFPMCFVLAKHNEHGATEV